MADDALAHQTKICTKCGEFKLRDRDFSRKASSPDGQRTYCKPCGAAYTRSWKADNPQYQAEYFAENAVVLKDKKRVYRSKNSDSIAAYNRGWRQKNPEYFRAWDTKNRASRRAATNRYHKRRKHEDPTFKLSRNISRGICLSLKGQKKGHQWQSLVGWSLAELVAHLERQFAPGMSWANYGDWHIDHRQPIVSFSFSTPADPDFKACWCLTNLQPMWSVENLAKGGRRVLLL